MGVKGFQRWAKYNLGTSNHVNCDSIVHLCFDTNSCLHEILNKVKTQNINIIVMEMLDLFSKEAKLFKNLRTIYMAIDGISSAAKMIHSRKRRYLFQQEKKDDVIQKMTLTSGTQWFRDFSKIFSEKVKNYVKEKNINIVLSTDQIPGEGEHKIFNYVNSLPIHEGVVIYGNDSDLLLLSLLTREKTTIYLIFSSELGSKIYEVQHIKNRVESLVIHGNNKMIDFVVLSFLIGNDFLPTFECVEMMGENNTLDFLIQSYNKKTSSLTEGGKIKWNVLMEI